MISAGMPQSRILQIAARNELPLSKQGGFAFTAFPPSLLILLILPLQIVIHVVGSYQVYTFCGLDLIELQVSFRLNEGALSWSLRF